METRTMPLLLRASRLSSSLPVHIAACPISAAAAAPNTHAAIGRTHNQQRYRRLTTLISQRSYFPITQSLSPSPTIHTSGPSQVPYQQTRLSSHSPMGSSSSGTPSRKKVTLNTIDALYRRGEPITMLTAHDFPSSHVADQAGMDIILVGDSLAMVALGMDDTSSVTVDEMLMHCRSVARGAQASFLVGDMPMGSYEVSPTQAVGTAIRFIKEGRMHAVKLEGGATMAPTIRAVVDAGIPVLAHVGLTPQRQNALGGFRVQGKTAASALQVLADARAVQAAGAFAVVLEAVPTPVAALVTGKLSIPTIGIGAGNGTSGQVLVQMDMSGFFPPGRFLPKFVKKYGDVWGEAKRAIEQYSRDVKSREYPAQEYSYPIKKEEAEEFERLVSKTAQSDGDVDVAKEQDVAGGGKASADARTALGAQ